MGITRKIVLANNISEKC